MFFFSYAVAEKISSGNQHNIDGSEIKCHRLVCAEPDKVIQVRRILQLFALSLHILHLLCDVMADRTDEST